MEEQLNDYEAIDMEATLALDEELNDVEMAFNEAFTDQQEYFREREKATATTSLLTTLALSPPDKPLATVFTENAILSAENAINTYGEQSIRDQLASRDIKQKMTQLNRLGSEIDFSADPALQKGFNEAYGRLMSYHHEEEAKVALEREAIKRIQQSAMSNPIQAQVLLDNLEFGGPDQTVTDFYTKMAVVRQRMDELDNEYAQSGWGRFLFNMVTNFVPTNFNFQRTGIMGTAGIWDFLAVGEAQAKEGNLFYHKMLTSSPYEWADYMAKDGEFMTSLRDNSSSIFDLVHDPGAAVEIMDTLVQGSSEDRNWNNFWGAVEVATVLPYKSIASATRLLVGSGDVQSAVRNMANRLDAAELRGEDAARRMTGIDEAEATEELSVSAIRGNAERPVPLTEPVAAHREAAQRVAQELFNTPEFTKFFSPEELQQYVLGRIEEMKKIVGSPVKDVHVITETLPSGQAIHRLKFTIGKKNGFGHASKGAATRALNATGFVGRVFEKAETIVRPARPKATVTQMGDASSVKEDALIDDDTVKAYAYKVQTESGDEIDISLLVHADGTAVTDISGMSTNQLGAKEMRRIAGQIADEIPEIKRFEGIRTTGARAKAFDENPDFNPEIPSIDAAQVRGRTETFQDHSGQWFAEITVDMPLSGWLTGKLQPEQQGFVSKMIGRWTAASARITDPTLRGMALEGASYINRFAKHLDNEVMGVFRRLNKQERTVVESIFTLGNIEQRWYSPDEVDNLAERAFGRKATEKEHNAYKDLWLFNDMDWELRNSAVYLDKLNKGYQTVRFKTRWGADVEDDVIIDYNMKEIPTERIYDASRNKHYVAGRNPMDQKTFDTMKNNGYVLVHLPRGMSLPEGITVNKMLIKKVDIEIDELRQTQLAYTPGGHRMYTSRYFVKQGRKGKQADTGKEFLVAPSTFRTADNLAEGNRWAATMNAARLAVKENRAITAVELDEQFFKQDPLFETGEEFLNNIADEFYDLDNPFETVIDRDLPSMYKNYGEDVSRFFDENEIGMNGYYATMGRMYTGKKGEAIVNVKTPLRDPDDPDYVALPDVLDPFDTLSKSLSQVSRQVGLQAYKLNATERFQNTYRDFFVDTPKNNNPVHLLTEGVLRPDIPVELRNQIEAQRNSILDVLRFEPEGDRIARQAWQRTAEKFLGDGDAWYKKLAHDSVWWWRDNNPISSARGLAFDMKLGMFNIGQLLVQSSTMISATALSPKYGMKGMMGLYPMWHYMLKRGDEGVLNNMVKRGTWKSMGFDTADEFKEYARHAFRHGFMEMNGAHILINNYGPGAHFGSFGEKQLKFREQARVFFYTSETFNRLVAYRIAWGEAREKGLAISDPQFSAEVLRRADDYSFNMTRESSAYWQRGVLSIPTQFWAYNARMIEAMFGKRFTPAQRARLITANFLMAGSAGIPGIAAVSEWIKQENGEAPPIDSLWGVADRGIIDYINYQATGADVLIGERVGTGGWATDTVKALFGASEYGQKSMIELLGGASYSIGKTTSQTIWDLAKYAVAESGAEDAGPITQENMIQVLREVSSFGNLTKAILLANYGMWQSNKGAVLADDLPPVSAAYAALSFRPAKADEIGYKMAYLKDKEEALKDVSTQLRNWRQEAMQTGDYEKYWKKANILIRLVPAQDRQEVLRRTNQIDDDSFYDYVERKVSEEQSNAEGSEE